MMSRSSVVLPVPLGPITAVIAPRRTRTFRPLNIVVAADRVVHVAYVDHGVVNAGSRARW